MSLELARHRPISSGARNVSSASEVLENEQLFEPCASTASLFLFAQGSTILSLHHDTLAIERRFQRHQDRIELIAVDTVSERGEGRLVVSYDASQTAIVWDLFSGDEVARFAAFEHIRVAVWMRNGNVAFGNGKGEVILFEPSTSEHVSARTIFDPITALAPASDCRTYAVGYQNGSILIATLQPSFTILHTLTTSRGPSPIVALAWHASSSKQKSDMLATQTSDGDLRVWSVAKYPANDLPRVIRALRRSESYNSGVNWISWSKNGRIVQYSERETWAWDVRTKNVTYEPIPTIEGIRGMAAHGPTSTLFTLGPDHTIQQYDLENPTMVANVQHLPAISSLPTPPDDKFKPMESALTAQNLARQATPESNNPVSSMSPIKRATLEMNVVDSVRQERVHAASPPLARGHVHSASSKASSDRYRYGSPPSRSGQRATTFSNMSPMQSTRDTPLLTSTSWAYPSSISTSSARSYRGSSRLRHEVTNSPGEKPITELFPFTKARLNDVPYMPPRSLDDVNELSSDDLRRQMLNVVFGWGGDIKELIQDELSRHPPGTQSSVLLSRWLGDLGIDQIASMGASGSVSSSDWMLLALTQMGSQAQTKQIGYAFVQRLLENGDIHSAAAILLGLGDRDDAIEVYVSRRYYMEAILMACLLYPYDWKRQSYLVRAWGEHVVQNSQQHLAIRCFSCTGVEPSGVWRSPSAQLATDQSRRPSAEAHINSQLHEGAILSPISSQPESRMTAKNSSLKLITSFGPQSGSDFRFPGLKTDDRTPTNIPGVTPIVDSAVGESVMSPGGFGNYKLNPSRNATNSTSRTATPGGYKKQRLPSIGETPIDVVPPPLPAPKALPTPVDSGSDKEKELEPAVQPAFENHSTSVDPPTLLTSAKYDPTTDSTIDTSVSEKRTPMTAIQDNPAGNFEGIRRPPSPPAAVFDSLKTSSQSRNGSRDRKPDGLHIQWPPIDGYGSGNSSVMWGSVPYSRQQPLLDSPSETRSITSNAQSNKSAKSPSVSGRSIDQCISSLEEANFYAKQQSRSTQSEAHESERSGRSKNKHGASRGPSQEVRGRTNTRYIPPAKRSPSSPLPMSPEDVAQYSAGTESFEDIYKAKEKAGSRRRSRSGHGKGRAFSRTGENHQRSQSRGQAAAEVQWSKPPSRNANRRHSPDSSFGSTGGRGRSTQKEGFGLKSPSSPVPMSTYEDEYPPQHELEDNLRLVNGDRERLRSRQRSSSRRPERGTSALREASPDRRRVRGRSSSRQATERDRGALRGMSTTSAGARIKRYPSSSGRHKDRDVPEGTSDVSRRPTPVQTALERTRKEIAAAELEARRLSLARRPSAPSIPLPGDVRIENTRAPPVTRRSRAYTGESTPSTGSSYNQNPGKSQTSPGSDSNSSGRASTAGVPVGLPATPRAMRHPKYSFEYPDENVPAVPGIPSGLMSTSTDQVNLTEGFKLDRSMSAPVPDPAFGGTSAPMPAGLPTHPRFQPEIPHSRSSSKTRRESTHRREGSLGGFGSALPVSTGIEETIEGGGRKPGSITHVRSRSQSQTQYTFQSLTNPVEAPPLLPELQHLHSPPPPPPPPPAPPGHTSWGSGDGSAVGIGTISIAIDDTPREGPAVIEPVNVPPPRPATTNPPPTTEPATIPPRMSADHRRGRSVNENFATKIRNFTERIHSTSRSRNNARSPPTEGAEYNPSPYESVVIGNPMDNRL